MAWLPQESRDVERAFNTRASHRFSSMLRECRIDRIRPSWIGVSDWAALQLKWDDPNYTEKCEKAKKNRASEKGGCINTAGSINTAEHLKRMEAMLGRPPSLDELHRQIHIREETGEYVDNRSREIQENFSEWRVGYRETQQSSGSEIDPDEEGRAAFDAWQKVVGPTKSNRLVGAGGLGFAAFRNSIKPNLRPTSSDISSGSSYVPNPSELNEVQLLTQKLSETQREMQERQDKYDQEMQQMREYQRLNDERWNQFMATMSPHQRPFMPSSSSSSSSSSYFPPQQMQPYGAFQPYGYPQPPFQSTYGQPYSQPQNQQQQQLHQPQQFHHQTQQQFHQPQQQQLHQPPQQPRQTQQQFNTDTNTDGYFNWFEDDDNNNNNNNNNNSGDYYGDN